jgi:hypothetical protein
LPCLKIAPRIAPGDVRDRGTSMAASVDCDCRRCRDVLLESELPFVAISLRVMWC